MYTLKWVSGCRRERSRKCVHVHTAAKRLACTSPSGLPSTSFEVGSVTRLKPTTRLHPPLPHWYYKGAPSHSVGLNSGLLLQDERLHQLRYLLSSQPQILSDSMVRSATWRPRSYIFKTVQLFPSRGCPTGARLHRIGT